MDNYVFELFIKLGAIGTGINFLFVCFGWITKQWQNWRKGDQVQDESNLSLAPEMTLAAPYIKVSGRKHHSWLRYPILAAISIPSLIVFWITSALLTTNSDSLPFVYIIYFIAAFLSMGCSVYAIVRSIQLRRWGWLIGMLLSLGDGAPFFSIWGPLARRDQSALHVPAQQEVTVISNKPPTPREYPTIPINGVIAQQRQSPLNSPITSFPHLPVSPLPHSDSGAKSLLQLGLPVWNPSSKMNGLSVAGLVLGIVGIILSWIPTFNLICPILAIIFGHVGLSQVNHSMKTQHGGGLGIAGFVLGYIGLLISTVVLLKFLLMI